jgi:hypothetical protein
MTKRGRANPNSAEQQAKRMLEKLDRISVKAVSIVSDKITPDGRLPAYAGIEAAREIRAMLTKVFADFSRSRKFRSLAQSGGHQ